jgi:hypothetical protein
MRWTYALAMMAMMLPLNSSANDGWINGAGKAMPETDAMKSSGGFAASLLVTSDADWRAKWETPPETTPGFTQADEVHPGGELFLLTFLSNPQLDENRVPKVHCDLRMLRGRQYQHRRTRCSLFHRCPARPANPVVHDQPAPEVRGRGQ